MQKIGTIQDLRGIAVLYVVLFHASGMFGIKIFSHGSSGLALFFVISGFIISIIHKDDRGFIDAKVFIKKRIARIYSPYLIPLFIIIILFFVSGKGSEYHRDIINIIRNIFLIQAPSLSIHPYSWTLVYEMYYYFTFCLFVIVLRVNVLAYALLMATPYLISVISTGGDVIDQDIVPLGFSNLYFCFGAIIGVFYNSIRVTYGIIPVLVSLLFFIAVPFFELSPIIFLLATGILFFIYSKSTISNNFLNKIGNASYSIYLIHAITLMVLKTIIETRSIFVFILFVIISIAAGYIYHLYVERPLVALSNKFLKINKSHTN